MKTVPLLLLFAVACGGSSPALGKGDAIPSDSPPQGDAGGGVPTVDAGPPAPSDASAPVTRGDAGPPAATDAGPPYPPQPADAGRSLKRGIAYGQHSDADLRALTSGVSWWYNWSGAPDSTLSASYASLGVEFVPMIWGGTFDTTKLAATIPQGATYLLTFNEPNFGAQSNLTPAAAAALWPRIEAFANSRGMKIVSPALNYCGGSCNETNPFSWLDAFFAACTGCRVDYIAAHWYACTESALKGYLGEYETRYGKPLWLTEFSCLDNANGTVSEEADYMQKATALLEADKMVFRYAWFTGRAPQASEIALLAAGSGAVTALGAEYLTLPVVQ